MPLTEIGTHMAAAAAVLVVRSSSSRAAGSAAVMPSSRPQPPSGSASISCSTIVIFASLFGGVLTLAILRFRLMPLPAALVNQEWAERLHRKDTGVPYGIALALAALVIYPDTPWMKSLGM